jgi:hypothetical protein
MGSARLVRAGARDELVVVLFGALGAQPARRRGRREHAQGRTFDAEPGEPGLKHAQAQRPRPRG